MVNIREATIADREAIRHVHLSAFSEEERLIVAALAVNLLCQETNPGTLSLVGEIDDTVVGHVAFSPVSSENITEWKGYILAPLGVKPNFQKRRIGSALIENGIAQLSARGANVVFVYGDPKYYGKFGFRADTASRYLLPYELQYPFGWQAIVLDDKVAVGASLNISCVAALCDPELW